jgi:hypothetical protein
MLTMRLAPVCPANVVVPERIEALDGQELVLTRHQIRIICSPAICCRQAFRNEILGGRELALLATESALLSQNVARLII